ncbi:MAG: DEAD/DEAH box helicase [Deltaproteobacteria bacterium]|nr:DEAD/DEAH box helicase [Deltaproteobacteria bacterium]
MDTTDATTIDDVKPAFVVEITEKEGLFITRIAGPVRKVPFDAYRLHCRSFQLRYKRKTRTNEALLNDVTLVDFVSALRKSDIQLQLSKGVQARLEKVNLSYAEEKEKEKKTEKVRDKSVFVDDDTCLSQIKKDLSRRNLALFPFQEAGVQWLEKRRRTLLADDMGLGKTMQALLAAPRHAPILVVCPAVAKGVWLREAALWRPDLNSTALVGRGSFRWPQKGELVVVNYAILPEDAPFEGVKSCHVDTVLIADEAHALKNRKAKRSIRFLKLSTTVQEKMGRVWLLTATPLLNRPPELWQILAAANLEKTAFTSWNRFKDLFHAERVKVARGVWALKWGDAKPQAVTCLKEVMLRRHKREVLPDLPEKRRQQWELPSPDANTRKLCKQAVQALGKAGASLDDAFGWLATDDPTALGMLSKARASLATWKTPHLLTIIDQYEENKEPLVVFSAYRAPIDALAEREGWALITGDVSPAKRTLIQDDFQAGNLRGVACTIRAGGLALTLTHASHVVFVDLDWTPALNAQAEDRVYRIGQKRGVLVTHLVADNAVDQMVTAALLRKETLIDVAVEAKIPKKKVIALREDVAGER